MKGLVDVVRNDLEARFSWKPDESGTTWDIEALRSLLQTRDIRVEVKDDDLEQALAFFESSGEPGESEVIARGLSPSNPSPMTAEMNVPGLPGDIEAALDAILSDAPPIEGDGYSNHGWAEAGSTVGTITPAVAPRAGLDLNRNPIAPQEPSGTDFLIGENLELQGRDLIATVSGILRFDDGGADLFPCARHSWRLDGSPDDGGCFLDFSPGHEALTLPSIPDIVTAAGRLGFLPEKLMPEDRIRALLASAVTEGRELTNQPISADTDARIDIVIDDMKIRAELVLCRETGNGMALELPSIAAAIRNSGIRGLDGDAVKAAIMEFWKSGEGMARIVIKEGQEPERGPDRELDFQVPFLEEEDAAPIRERLEFEPEKVKGLASLRAFPPSAVSKMARVENEQLIARLGTARSGKAGRDIYGAECPGFPGNDPDIRVHEGLEWDGDSLLARTDGLLDIGNTGDGRTHFRIRPHKDAEIRVTVSSDGIKAFISTRPPIGTGAPVDADRIRDEAEAAGVKKGFLDEAVNEIVERSLAGEFVTHALIAEGRLPMADNTRLSLTVSGDPAKAPIPVKAGDRIGTVMGGEEGGWNVFGEPLMDDGDSLKEGECILRREEDGVTVLIAEKGGHLVMSEGRLLVKDLLDYVGDISLASGNVRFPGRIKIDGSILSRVIVDGGEGVDVSQVVQAALVNSGGDVSIGKGIKGMGRPLFAPGGISAWDMPKRRIFFPPVISGLPRP